MEVCGDGDRPPLFLDLLLLPRHHHNGPLLAASLQKEPKRPWCLRARLFEGRGRGVKLFGGGGGGKLFERGRGCLGGGGRRKLFEGGGGNRMGIFEGEVI